MPVSAPKNAWRVLSAITISSSDALPARSPMPLRQHSTCVAPPRTAASELATASPRSLWQWQESVTPAAPGTLASTSRKSDSYSSGIAKPTVSGRFTVVAPASIAACTTR